MIGNFLNNKSIENNQKRDYKPLNGCVDYIGTDYILHIMLNCMDDFMENKTKYCLRKNVN